MTGVAINANHDAIESEPQAILILDAEGRVLHVDEVAERQLGDGADAFYGLNIRQLFSGLVKENETVTAVAREPVYRRCVVGSGNRCNVAFDARIRRLGGGQDARFVVTFITHERIDELKQAEGKLRLKQTRLQDAAHIANLGYFERYMRGEVALEWSPETARIMGYGPTELCPTLDDFYQIVHHEDRERMRSGAVEAFRAKVPYEIEYRIVHRNGDVRWIHSIARPVFDDNGEIDRFFGVLQDVTSYKLAIAELEAKNNALEAARLEADQANTAKSRFLAMMSHEIRTPLNGVLGMAGVLLDDLTDSPQRSIVETIRTSGDALLTIINDILDFSKIEAGLMELEEQPFALRHCLDDVIDLIGPRARKKFIELGFIVSPDVPVGIFGDITRLRQVLVNLVDNALKFTEGGEVAVEVKRGQPDPSGKLQLHFAVRDTGIGIAAERVTRLFQTFSQVDVSINRKYGGTGLGLAICKRLVELMGGRIWVESTPNVGSTFQFTIPTSSAADVSSELLEAIAVARRDLEGKRVLIVDDSPMTRRILSEQLQSFGLVPVVASSGEQALALLRAKPDNEVVDLRSAFVLVVLDVEMPGMNGTHLAAVIRGDAHLADLPLLFLTASHGVSASVTSQWRAPCLSKPVKQSTLFDGIMRVLLHSPLRSSRGPRSIPIDSTLGLRLPLRILLAEDNVINQKVALLLLQRAGYRADIAANGQEVLDAVATKAYDLILMDVQMPEMDGLEATRHLRGPGPWLGKPRIVAVTADVMQEGKEACIAAGMDDFMAKPIRVHELMRLLERSAVQQAKERASEEAWLPGTEAQLVAVDDMTLDEEAFAAIRSVCALEGDDTLGLLVTEFLADSRKILADLLDLLDQGDLSTMERLAHTLKGTAGTFGAKGLSRQMADIEQAIRERKTVVLEVLLGSAIAEHGRVRQELLARCSNVLLDT